MTYEEVVAGLPALPPGWRFDGNSTRLAAMRRAFGPHVQHLTKDIAKRYEGKTLVMVNDHWNYESYEDEVPNPAIRRADELHEFKIPGVGSYQYGLHVETIKGVPYQSIQEESGSYIYRALDDDRFRSDPYYSSDSPNYWYVFIRKNQRANANAAPAARAQCTRPCNPTRVCNPASGRCVLRNGAIGKTVIAQASGAPAKQCAVSCATGKVCNPVSGRCIASGGAVAQRVFGLAKSSKK